MARKLADPYRPRHSLKRLDWVDTGVVDREGLPVFASLIARIPHLIYFQSVSPEGDELEIYYEMVFAGGRSQIEPRDLKEILEASRTQQLPTSVFQPERERRPRRERPSRQEPTTEEGPPGAVGTRPRRAPSKRPGAAEYTGLDPDILRAIDEEAMLQRMIDLNLSYDAMKRVGDKIKKKSEEEED